jgi:hypothetical protein
MAGCLFLRDAPGQPAGQTLFSDKAIELSGGELCG